MNENITVIDKNGNNIIAEGISCIQFVSSGRKYILYTLNEKVENDLTKMYVGEIGDTVGSLDKISDEEWMHIKTTLNGISHGESNPDLKYLRMGDFTLNIGVPKKLAIKPDVKQAFSDKYTTSILSNSQSVGIVPAQVGQSNSPFFNTDVVSDEAKVESVESGSANSGSIFENPMKPDLTAQTVSPDEAKSEDTQASENNGGVEMISTTPTEPVVSSIEPITTGTDEVSTTIEPVNAVSSDSTSVDSTEESNEANVVMQAAPIAPAVPEVPTVPEIPQNPVDAVSTGVEEIKNVNTEASSVPMTDESSDVINPTSVTNPVVEDLSKEVMADVNIEAGQLIEEPEEIPEPVTLQQQLHHQHVKGVGERLITKEEALEALNIINKYISQGGSGFINFDSEQMSNGLSDEEVSVPKYELEDTTGEEFVEPSSELSTMPPDLTGPVLGMSSNDTTIDESTAQEQKVDSAVSSGKEVVTSTNEHFEGEQTNSSNDESNPLNNNLSSGVELMNVIPEAGNVENVENVENASTSVEENQAEKSDQAETSIELSLNAPDLIPTIDIPPIPETQAESSTLAESKPAEENNNFISLDVNDINNMVDSNKQESNGDALTGVANLINLDAITSVPEIDLPTAGETALTGKPISNAYVNSDPSGIPVTLPNNYNSNAVSPSDSVLGPGSLPVDNN